MPNTMWNGNYGASESKRRQGYERGGYDRSQDDKDARKAQQYWQQQNQKQPFWDRIVKDK